MNTKTIPATKAKTQFAELIEAAREQPITITRNNRPVAVVMSPAFYKNFSSNSQKRHRMTKEEMFGGATFKSGDPHLSEKVDEIVYGNY